MNGKATATLAAMLIGVAIGGCGSATPPGSATTLAEAMADRAGPGVVDGAVQDRRLRLRMIEYATAVVNAGTPVAFTAYVRDVRTLSVRSSSAASITVEDGVLSFPTPLDRQRWAAAGSHGFASGPQHFSLPPGQFSFVPQGRVMTYRQAARLPATAKALADEIARHLGPHPSATDMLWQLGYLAATAPLSPGARAAAWQAVAALPELHLCGWRFDLAGRHGESLCVDASGEQSDILVDPNTGSVLAVEDRLLRQSQSYPHVPAGGLVLSTTFVPN